MATHHLPQSVPHGSVAREMGPSNERLGMSEAFLEAVRAYTEWWSLFDAPQCLARMRSSDAGFLLNESADAGGKRYRVSIENLVADAQRTILAQVCWHD